MGAAASLGEVALVVGPEAVVQVTPVDVLDHAEQAPVPTVDRRLGVACGKQSPASAKCFNASRICDGSCTWP
jgi:hypothetical protein